MRRKRQRVGTATQGLSGRSFSTPEGRSSSRISLAPRSALAGRFSSHRPAPRTGAAAPNNPVASPGCGRLHPRPRDACKGRAGAVRNALCHTPAYAGECGSRRSCRSARGRRPVQPCRRRRPRCLLGDQSGSGECRLNVGTRTERFTFRRGLEEGRRPGRPRHSSPRRGSPGGAVLRCRQRRRRRSWTPGKRRGWRWWSAPR
jgi:hypothetical protein